MTAPCRICGYVHTTKKHWWDGKPPIEEQAQAELPAQHVEIPEYSGLMVPLEEHKRIVQVLMAEIKRLEATQRPLTVEEMAPKKRLPRTTNANNPKKLKTRRLQARKDNARRAIRKAISPTIHPINHTQHNHTPPQAQNPTPKHNPHHSQIPYP